MTKTVFVPSTPIASAFLNAINNPVFRASPANDGEIPLITNSDLSDAAGQIKPEWTTFRDALKVSAGTGLSVTYTGGAITLDTGLIATIAPGTLVVSDNTTTYVYVDRSGAVTSSSTIPAYWSPLAKVVTVAGAVSTITDLRERFKISPLTRAIQTFGSGGYEGDLTVNAGQTVTVNGLHYYRNVTIATGGTVNVTSGWAYLKASGSVSIQGVINVTPPVAGGAGFQSSVCGANFQYFGASGSGLGRGAGINQAPAPAYPHLTQSGLGSGGAVGYAQVGSAAATISTAQGGAGGGAIFIEAAGTVSIAGSITCNGGNATTPSVSSTGSALASGGSGGSGGTISIASLTSITTTAAAVLSAKGGNGSSGAKINSATDSIGGGGGGGGGYVIFFAPTLSINVSSQLLVAGGTGGAGIVGSGGNYYGSCAGASFGGQGGANDASNVNSGTGFSGSSGQLLQYSFTPV